jgi:hypothetical protein
MAKKAKRSKKARRPAPAAKKSTVKKPAAKKAVMQLTADQHERAFSQLIAHAHTYQKSPLCYKEFPDGSAQVCKLLPDGSYGNCEDFFVRPVPGPRCG